MRRIFLAAILVAISASARAVPPTPAAGGTSSCSLEIQASPGSTWLVRGYDPFGDTNATGTYSLTFRNQGSETCRFTPVFSLDRGEPFGLSSGSGGRVAYLLRDTTRGLNVTPLPGHAALTAGQARLEIAAGGQITLNYQFAMVDPDIRQDGDYMQNVNVEAQEADLNVIAGTSVRLGVEVLPSARIGLAGAYVMNHGQAIVDLGDLEQGEAGVPLRLRVNSTRGYKLSVASLNRGRLRLGSTDWYVPYALRLGDHSIGLAGEDDVNVPGGSQPQRDTLPFHFHIGDVSDRRAGTYSDVISISIAPL